MYIDDKVESFELHNSQAVRDERHLIHAGAIRDLASMRGREIGVAHAERYYLYREII